MKEMAYSAPYSSNIPQPNYLPPQNQFIPAPDIHKIRDWLPWSIVSILIGWGLGGIIPLIFSILCRSNKRSNDYQTARLMSNLALVFNIIITIGGIAAWIGFIVWLVIYIRILNSVTSTYP
ncbi:hypothetical protein I4U23_001196 [Adineta vaga]|nr:hypothetical protein I4U23_001196 [Adineta vaga]